MAVKVGRARPVINKADRKDARVSSTPPSSPPLSKDDRNVSGKRSSSSSPASASRNPSPPPLSSARTSAETTARLDNLEIRAAKLPLKKRRVDYETIRDSSSGESCSDWSDGDGDDWHADLASSEEKDKRIEALKKEVAEKERLINLAVEEASKVPKLEQQLTNRLKMKLQEMKKKAANAREE